MTKNEIKEMMLEHVKANLESALEDIGSHITEEDIESFMWDRDYGQELVDEYLEEYAEEEKEQYLSEIFDDIEVTDLR